MSRKNRNNQGGGQQQQGPKPETDVLEKGAETTEETPKELTDIEKADKRLVGMTKQMSKCLGRIRYWMGDDMTPCGTMQIKEVDQIRGKKSEAHPRGQLLDNCRVIEFCQEAHLDEAEDRNEAVYVTLNLRNAQGKPQDAILTRMDEDKMVVYVSFDTFVDAGVRASSKLITHAKSKDTVARGESDSGEEENHYDF